MQPNFARGEEVIPTMPSRRPRAGHPATCDTVGPKHHHECAECVYLGTTGPTDAFREYTVIDHYWCPHGNVGLPTLIQRYGSGAHQYLSMPVKVCHPQSAVLLLT